MVAMATGLLGTTYRTPHVARIALSPCYANSERLLMTRCAAAFLPATSRLGLDTAQKYSFDQDQI